MRSNGSRPLTVGIRCRCLQPRSAFSEGHFACCEWCTGRLGHYDSRPDTVRCPHQCHPGVSTSRRRYPDGQFAVGLIKQTASVHKCGAIVCNPGRPPKTRGSAVTSAENEEAGAAPSTAAGDQTEQKSMAEKRPEPPGFVSAHWRSFVAAAVEVAGIGVLSAGFWLIRPWAGLIVLGVGLIAMGVASSPRFDRRRLP
jgi:hypothetical protein